VLFGGSAYAMSEGWANLAESFLGK